MEDLILTDFSALQTTYQSQSNTTVICQMGVFYNLIFNTSAPVQLVNCALVYCTSFTGM